MHYIINCIKGKERKQESKKERHESQTDSKSPDVCASSRPKQQLYKTLHTPFTDDNFIIFTSRLFLKHREDDFNLLSTFTLKQGVRFTRCCVPWLMISSSLI